MPDEFMDRFRATFRNPEQDLASFSEERDFFSPEVSRSRLRSVRSAETEARRSTNMLRSIGFGQEVDEVEEAMKVEGAIPRVFNALQASNFAIAGGVREIQEGGNVFDSIQRGLSEFASASSFAGVDDETANSIFGKTPQRETFEDVFQAYLGGEDGDMSNAVLGLIADIAFDPLTYTSLGVSALPKLGVAGKVLSKALPYVSPFSAAGDIGKKVLATETGRHAVKELFRKGKFGNIPNFLGETFSTKFKYNQALREAGTQEEREAIISFMDNLLVYGVEKDLGTSGFGESLAKIVSENKGAFSEKGGFIENRGGLSFIEKADGLGSVNVKDFMEHLFSDTNDTERKVIGLFMDQPEKIKEIFEKAVPDRAGILEHKVNVMTDYFKLLVQEESSAGLYSPSFMKSMYSNTADKISGQSKKLMDKMFKDLGIRNARESIFSRNKGDVADIIDMQGFDDLNSKYASLEERIRAAIPSEIDIATLGVKRGFESTRRIANKHLHEAVFNNPEVGVEITDTGGDLIRYLKTPNADILARLGPDEARRIIAKKEEIFEKFSSVGYTLHMPNGPTKSGAKGLLKSLGVGKRFRKNGAVYEVSEVAAKKGEKEVVKARLANGSSKKHYTFDAEDEVREIEDAAAFMLPDIIAKNLDQTDRAFMGGEETRELLKGFDKLTSMWRGYAVLSTGFHIRNLQGNVFLNWLGGVAPNPKRYAEALSLQRGKGGNVRIMVGDKTFEGQELIRLADRHGIRNLGIAGSDLGILDSEAELLTKLGIRSGSDGAELRKALADSDNPVVKALSEDTDGNFLTKTMRNNFGQGGRLLKNNRDLGSAIENNSRLTHFLYRLRKGDSPEQAAASVKQYLFDYSDLTDRERDVFRRALPFYTWVRKNTPLMFGELVRQPDKFSLLPKGFGAVENLSKDMEDIPTPDYFQEVTAIRMPKFVNEATRDVNTLMAKFLYSSGILKEKPSEVTGLQPVYLKPDLPFQDLDVGMPSEAFGKLVSGLNPLIRAPFEYAGGPDGRGFSFFTERPVERFEGEPSEVSLIPFLPIHLRERTQKALESFAPPLGKINRIRNRAQKGQLASQLTSELFGLKFIQNDLDQARALKAYKRRDKLRNLKKRLQEEGRIR